MRTHPIPLPAANQVRLDQLRRRVDGCFAPGALADILGPIASETQALAYDWLARGGRRWRPLLAACVGQALLGDKPLPEDFARVAVGIECFHKASLVHDDIEDADEFRYGGATIHAEHGVAIALNVGDYLCGEGYRLLSETNVPAEHRAAMLAATARGHRTLALGQGAELFWRRRPGVLSPEEVLEIFREKTASAFEVALRLGALYVGASSEVLEVLACYSTGLGIAYQIADDLADADADAPGAGPGDESIRPSLLVSLAAERLGGPERERLVQLANRPGANAREHGELRELYRRVNVHSRARQLLAGYKADAVEALSCLREPLLGALLGGVLAKIFADIENTGRPAGHMARTENR